MNLCFLWSSSWAWAGTDRATAPAPAAATAAAAAHAGFRMVLNICLGWWVGKRSSATSTLSGLSMLCGGALCLNFKWKCAVSRPDERLVGRVYLSGLVGGSGRNDEVNQLRGQLTTTSPPDGLLSPLFTLANPSPYFPTTCCTWTSVTKAQSLRCY